MAETMAGQPAQLRRILEDWDAVDGAAARIADRRVFLVGTGTSWHAANHGAYLLRAAGLEAWAVQAADAALHGPRPTGADCLILLSHRGTKRYTNAVLERARADGVASVVISGRGVPGADLETVPQERSSAFTASHLGALARLAQLACALGADLGDLGEIPKAVALALSGPGLGVAPPGRLLQLTGAGPNQWTAAEGALKVRETACIASEGLAVEQLLHGPSVALGADDALVCLDGGGPGSSRLMEVARAAELVGTKVYVIRHTTIGEPLSIFPLTVRVQRIALECAERLALDPDAFGFGLPGHEEAWGGIEL